MLLAVLLTLLATGAALAVARHRRIHRAILALVGAFIALGAVVGSVPGAFVLIGFTVVAATGPSSGIDWALWTTLAALGTLAGIALGAGGAGALARPHVNRIGARAASTAFFALVGVGLASVILAVTPAATGALLSMLAALVTSTSVLGFVLPRTR